MAGLSLRRTRLHRGIRELTREVRLSTQQFIQPLFVVDGLDTREPVPGLDGVWRDTPDSLAAQIEADLQNGISKFLLFGVPVQKHATQFEHDFTARQIAAIKQRFGDDLWLATDVCLCSSTDHGHCGIVNAAGTQVINAATVSALTDAALQFAAAGADCVAPSDMMDGRIGAIRRELDAAGHEATALLSYAAKFHSAHYGPFRVAADSAPGSGVQLSDRASYQIDPARPNDALRCALRDADEGADILMVKPALPYLDVLRDLSNAIPLPWAAYQTSGETAGIHLVARERLGDPARMQVEAWTAMVRAGANAIISYDARRATDWLTQTGNA